MLSLTALVLTFNEEANISRTLGSLKWLGEVVLLDSGSTDRTIELAKATHPNVSVVERRFDTHATQWNFGLDQIKTEWALSLDADYEVSPQLAAELTAFQPAKDIIGYEASFEYRIYGHPLRASVYPPRIVLFRVNQARYVDEGHTQKLWVRNPASQELRPPSDNRTTGQQDHRIGRLAGLIYHDDRKALGHWLRAQDSYSKLEARHLRSMPVANLSFQDRLRRKMFLAAPAIFFYLLLGRRLILDGWPGWFYVAQRTIAELMLSLRLLTEREKLESPDR